MKIPNDRKKNDRDGVRMAGMILILAAEEGDDADVLAAMKAIDPFALMPLAEKFSMSVVPTPPEGIKVPVVAKIPFPEFEAACFLHDADPKYCTCYKHKDNVAGRAICSEPGCPLYGEGVK